MIIEYKKGDRDKLSKDFNLSEFHCHCIYPDCEVTYVDSSLVTYLQRKRDELGLPLSLDCAFRCTRHNKDVGGKPGSIHLQGKAADITINGGDINSIADKFDDADGLGRYPTRHFIHVDVRGYKARWVG